MILEINRRNVEPDLVVLEMKGRITLGRESQRLEGMIRDLLNEKVTRVVLDITGVDYADSAGLGILTFCHATMKKAGGALRFANPSSRVAELFHFTLLEKIFSIHPTVEDACKDFTIPL